jgi:hypothetical protein
MICNLILIDLLSLFNKKVSAADFPKNSRLHLLRSQRKLIKQRRAHPASSGGMRRIRRMRRAA